MTFVLVGALLAGIISGIIMRSIFGGIAFFVLLIFFFIIWRYMRSQEEEEEGQPTTQIPAETIQQNSVPPVSVNRVTQQNTTPPQTPQKDI